MNKLFILTLCFMIGCGGTSVIEGATGTGGAGGSEMTSSVSSGEGGSSTSTDTETTSDSTTDSTTSTSTSTSTITSTEDFCANVPDTFFCSHDGFICCDKLVDATFCTTSELGYCCPNDYFCIPIHQ